MGGATPRRAPAPAGAAEPRVAPRTSGRPTPRPGAARPVPPALARDRRPWARAGRTTPGCPLPPVRFRGCFPARSLPVSCPVPVPFAAARRWRASNRLQLLAEVTAAHRRPGDMRSHAALGHRALLAQRSSRSERVDETQFAELQPAATTDRLGGLETVVTAKASDVLAHGGSSKRFRTPVGTIGGVLDGSIGL